ncbi:hypothetical protein [Achromobacter xylosoxidans]|uniref:hypothetical protein n=1 Tax=Alcaligenes xylosoxydans xylosoxydans TaxID=85698 RepID=UPI0010411921|nr:hypothetical protein [Achromobacter xylosoxidans]
MTTSHFNAISPEHAQQLGQMIAAHSMAEAVVFSVFLDCCGLEEAQARVIINVGKIKVSDMPAITEQLLDLKASDDAEADATLKAALRELRQLTEQRNKFAHWQWGVGDNGLGISNLVKGKMGQPPKSQPVPLEELQNLTQRIQDVVTRLMLCTPTARRAMPAALRDLFLGSISVTGTATPRGEPS